MDSVYDGIVKWFNNSIGYGFIHPVVNGESDESVEYFVHYKNINMKGFKTLNDGQHVRFKILNTDKGNQAVDVEISV